MSLSSVSSDAADRSIRSRYSRCWMVSDDCCINRVRPSTALSGVRTSWLMLARKSLLAWLLASACARACSISACRLRRAVMSRLNPVTSVGMPFASRWVTTPTLSTQTQPSGAATRCSTR